MGNAFVEMTKCYLDTSNETIKAYLNQMIQAGMYLYILDLFIIVCEADLELLKLLVSQSVSP